MKKKSYYLETWPNEYFFLYTVEEQGGNPCVGVKSCGKCIATSPKCGWCGDLDYDKTNQDRCDLLENLKNLGCSAVNISNPNNKLDYLEVSSTKCSNFEGIG